MPLTFESSQAYPVIEERMTCNRCDGTGVKKMSQLDFSEYLKSEDWDKLGNFFEFREIWNHTIGINSKSFFKLKKFVIL